MVKSLGLWSMGVSIILLGIIGLLLAWPKRAAPIAAGVRLPFLRVLGKVFPHGSGLALGSIGFGTIATFITLYYASRDWNNAALCLSVFGACFIGARLLFGHLINRIGGFRVAIACLAVEALGLLMLWQATSASWPWRAPPSVVSVFAGVSGAGRRGGQSSLSCQPRGCGGRLFAIHRSVAGHHRALGGRGGVGLRLCFDLSVRRRRGGLRAGVESLSVPPGTTPAPARRRNLRALHCLIRFFAGKPASTRVGDDPCGGGFTCEEARTANAARTATPLPVDGASDARSCA